jgi:hypothetical protein
VTMLKINILCYDVNRRLSAKAAAASDLFCGWGGGMLYSEPFCCTVRSPNFGVIHIRIVALHLMRLMTTIRLFLVDIILLLVFRKLFQLSLFCHRHAFVCRLTVSRFQARFSSLLLFRLSMFPFNVISFSDNKRFCLPSNCFSFSEPLAHLLLLQTYKVVV